MFYYLLRSPTFFSLSLSFSPPPLFPPSLLSQLRLCMLPLFAMDFLLHVACLRHVWEASWCSLASPFFVVLNQAFFGCRYCWEIQWEIPSWLTCTSVTILRGVCRPSSKLYVSIQTDLEVFPGSGFQSWTFFCLGHSLKP